MKTRLRRRFCAGVFGARRFELLEERRLLTLGIDVGHHELLPDTPGQAIDIYVHSDESDVEVTDFLLRAQIGRGEAGQTTPIFQCSQPACIVPPRPTTAVPWFAGNGQIWDNLSTTVVGGPLFENPPDVPADFPNVAQATVTIDAAGMTTRADGLLVRLEVDTTGIPAGNTYDLKLADTIIGVDSHFLTTGPVRIEPVITNGTIAITDNTALRVLSVELNQTQTDPPDLPSGSQPTSWAEQRSDLRSITVRFNDDVEIQLDDVVLTNLGVNAPTDADVEVPLDLDQLTISGRELVIHFSPDTPRDLNDGVYRLELLPTISSPSGLELDGNGDGNPGDAYLIQGDASNGLYQLTADWNADLGVSIFDFPTFAYWFGSSIPDAPTYIDLNSDDGVSIFDFPIFASNFQSSIVTPSAFALTVPALPVSSVSGSRSLDGAERTVTKIVDLIWQPLGEMVARPSRPVDRVILTDDAWRDRGRDDSLDELLHTIANENRPIHSLRIRS